MSSRKLLESVSRETLVKRCLELEQALLRNNLPLPSVAAQQHKSGKKVKPKRPFDFAKYSKRKIALKVAYLGEKYHGLAIQESSPDTIEAHLFAALQKAKLIDDIKNAQYSRCGRTDKGVSAYCQVVSLVVRSNLTQCRGLVSTPDVEPAKKKAKATGEEMDYTRVLNGLLPPEIRVVDWGAVDTTFDARFSCISRHYKYFFHRNGMDIQAMRRACTYLLGEHDFRNFCKADVAGGVTNFVRTVMEARVVPIEVGPDHAIDEDDGDSVGEDEVWEFNIVGRAFLWHQVRCIMAVLFMVGKGHEQPEVVQHLLDVRRCTHKPQYVMAPDLPLVLYNCNFEGIEWQGNTAHQAARLHAHWHNMWRTNSIRNTLLKCFMGSFGLTGVRDFDGEPWDQCRHGVHEPHSPPHRPLAQRQTEESIEERMAKAAAKQKEQEAGEAGAKKGSREAGSAARKDDGLDDDDDGRGVE